MKVCRHCKLEKSLDNFYKKFKNKEWRTNLCKECTAKYYSERHKKYKDIHLKTKNWINYLHKHENGYFLKACNKHGNLEYSQIGLHQKLENGIRSPVLYCIQCRNEGKEKRFNEEIRKQRLLKNDNVACNACNISKPIIEFTSSELKNKYCICRVCRQSMDKRYDAKVSMMKNFKFTSVQYEEMLKKQNGVCAICKQPEKQIRFGRTIKLSVDHCHKSLAKDHTIVRGLLCTNCNKGIGCLQDSSEYLRAAANYLDSYYAST